MKRLSFVLIFSFLLVATTDITDTRVKTLKIGERQNVSRQNAR